MPQWNTISISGYHIREAGSTAVQEVAFTLANAIAYVAGGRRRRPRRQRVRPAAVVLLQRAQRLPRGDRQVPRRAAAVGAHHARPLRRHQSARAAAALPHPDGGQHADRAAARQQHRPRRAAGAGRGARRHAVAALQRPGRGAGAADRGERDDRAAHAADHPARERRRQHRRSGRRLVRDRGADQSDRSEARGRCSTASTRMGGTLAAIEAGFIQRQIQDSAYAAQQAIDAGDAVVVGVNRYADDAGSRRPPRSSASIPEIERAADRARARRARRPQRRRSGARRSTRSTRPRAAATIWCRRSSPRSRSRRRSARSPTRCARVFGEYQDVVGRVD